MWYVKFCTLGRSSASEIQRFERPFDGRQIARAEDAHVHQQRVELIERDAAFVLGRERMRLLVGVEDARGEAAEEAHHRQIDLSVTAINRGIDEHGRARGVHVTAPEVAVQARGRLVGAHSLGQDLGERIEAAPERAG